MNNNITCGDVNTTEDSLCIFTLKTFVCELSNESSLNSVTVTLKGDAYYYNSCVTQNSS